MVSDNQPLPLNQRHDPFMLHRYYPNACLIKEIVFTLFIIFQNYRTEFYLCLKWLSLGCI